eukprot:10245-Pyramimonas_sp.AAC.1
MFPWEGASKGHWRALRHDGAPTSSPPVENARQRGRAADCSGAILTGACSEEVGISARSFQARAARRPIEKAAVPRNALTLPDHLLFGCFRSQQGLPSSCDLATAHSGESDVRPRVSRIH